MRANRLAPSPAMTHLGPIPNLQANTKMRSLTSWQDHPPTAPVTHRLGRSPTSWEDHPPAGKITRRLGRSTTGWEDQPPAGKINHRLGRSTTGSAGHPPAAVTELHLQSPTQHCHPKPAQRHSESPLSFRIPPLSFRNGVRNLKCSLRWPFHYYDNPSCEQAP